MAGLLANNQALTDKNAAAAGHNSGAAGLMTKLGEEVKERVRPPPPHYSPRLFPRQTPASAARRAALYADRPEQRDGENRI